MTGYGLPGWADGDDVHGAAAAGATGRGSGDGGSVGDDDTQQ